MSTYCHYQAWPTAGGMLLKLQTDAKLNALYAGLLHQPCGPFDIARLDPTELNELLDHLAKQEKLGNRASVDGLFSDFQAEKAAGCKAHPGLPDRAAYLQIGDEFEDALIVEFEQLGRADPEWDANRLIFGCEPLGADLFPNQTSDLQLVPNATVIEAASWLGKIAPEQFGLMASEFESWRSVFLEAAMRRESIVIG